MWKSLQKNSRQLRGVMNVWHRNDKLLTLLFSIHQMKQGMQVLADSCPSAKPLQDSSFQAVQSLSNSQTYSAKVKHEDTFIHPSVVKWNQFLTPKKKKHIISENQHSKHLFWVIFCTHNFALTSLEGYKPLIPGWDLCAMVVWRAVLGVQDRGPQW